ncbi:hypothetical protein C882_2206 [Caenispirillum salinarum AK4]|uniref:DUF6468 domain-containing protein n=1 Tax=Caenispirillum salinarum AK4 TaxID=1238182 RepID=K9GNN8_9PROT|nr:DUF6468 domain-containing protein [Caenispirillum salinarum]EKV26697.1 hypothetical protein C882_2206 [Caenispirillum salinarum AK4]
MDFKLILDIIVVLLLIPTIVFAVMLNNRLSVLRKNRDELARLIGQFNEATVRAESGIPRLRKAAEDAGKGLQDRVERANALRDDLAFLCERADETATALEQTLRAARNEMKAVPGSALSGNGTANGTGGGAAMREPGAPAPGPAPASQAVASARPQAPQPQPRPQAPRPPQPQPQVGAAGGGAAAEGRPRAQVPAPRAAKASRPLAPPASNLGGGTEDLTRALRGLAEAAESSAEDHEDDALFSPEPERSEAERELLRALRSVR